MSNPVLEKANRIHEAGLLAVAAGTITSFTLAANIRQRYNCSLHFYMNSDFTSRLFGPVQDSSVFWNVGLLLASRDFSVHCTLGEALTAEDAPDRFSFAGAYGLVSKELVFTELVVDKGNLLLAASEIPEDVQSARSSLEQFYENEKLTPLRIENLLHITLARVKSGDPESVRHYVNEMVQLRERIHHRPIHLTVSLIYTGSAAQLLGV